MIAAIDLKERIVAYYSSCWTNRFVHGHNMKSLAMHHGYYTSDLDDYELAKMNMNKLVLEKFNFKKYQNKTLVDVGCGVGGTGMHFLEMMPNLTVIGINLSKNQLFLAEQFAKQKNVFKSMVFQQGDYTQMELEDSSVDGVYGIESICHAADKSAVYMETYRVLRSAGKLVICDYFLNQENLNDENRGLLEVFQEGWEIPNCHIDFRKHLRQSGFCNIQFSDISKKVVMGIERSSSKAKLKLPHLLNGTPSPMERHLKSCIALNVLTVQGVISYGVLSATKA